MRRKKFAVFLLVLLAICGFITVDSACADLVDQEAALIPQVKRIDEEHVSLSLFGQTASINTREMEESYKRFVDQLSKGFQTATKNIAQLFEKYEEKVQEKKAKEKNEEEKDGDGRKYDVIHGQTL